MLHEHENKHIHGDPNVNTAAACREVLSVEAEVGVGVGVVT